MTSVVIKNIKVNLAIVPKDLHFEVGIIKDTSHYSNTSKVTSKKGVKVRDVNKKKKNNTMVEVAEANEKRYNFLSKPKNSDKGYYDIVNSYFEGLPRIKNNSKLKKSLENLIKVPMKKGSYKNKSKTTKVKGFNRGSVDTGQLYNNIESLIYGTKR